MRPPGRPSRGRGGRMNDWNIAGGDDFHGRWRREDIDAVRGWQPTAAIVTCRRPVVEARFQSRNASRGFESKVTKTPSGSSRQTALKLRFDPSATNRSSSSRQSICSAIAPPAPLLVRLPRTRLAAIHSSLNRRYSAWRHSAQGRWPAARATASSRKKSSVYRPGVMGVRLRPRNSVLQMSHASRWSVAGTMCGARRAGGRGFP